MRKIGSALLIAVLLVAGALTLIDNVWHDSKGTAVLRFVLAVLELTLLVAFVLFVPSVRSPEKTALGRPRPTRTSKREIFEAYDEVTQSYTKETLNLLVSMLIDLPEYIVRISEEAQLEEAPLILITTRQYYEVDKATRRFRNRPDKARVGQPGGTVADEKKLMLVPLMQPEKGALIDSFTVTDASGCELPTLTHNRTRALVIYTLEALREIAIEAGGTANGASPDVVRSDSQPAFAKIVAAVCSAGPSRTYPSNQKMIDEALTAVNSLPLMPAWRDKIRGFCRQYIDCYVIIAEAPTPPGDHLVLSYSYRVPCEGRTNQRANRWRSRFGLTPATFDLPVNVHAFQVDAYHLQMSSDGGGQYVYDHHLEWLNTREAVTQGDLRRGDFKPYVRVYHDEGRPNAHLYIRRQSSAPPPPGLSRLKSVIQFREIPPGVMGAATVVAGAGAALITFFALTHLGLDVDVESGGQQDQITATLNSDIPALLLALPAFTAAPIGSWTDLSRVRRASLTTYLALAATMILSLTSAFYFVYDANHKLPTELTVRLLGGVSLTTEAFWLTLMGLSWTLILFMFRQWVSESRHYFKAIKRRVDRQLHETKINKEGVGR